VNNAWQNLREIKSESLYFTKNYDVIEEIFDNRYVPKIIAKLEYWFSKPEYHQNGFYKFTEPCENVRYQFGESWSEELRCSRPSFRKAFQLIGTVHSSKGAYLESEDPFGGKLYCSYFDRIKKITVYLRNNEQADAILGSLFGKKTSISTETHVEIDQDMDLYNRIITIFREETHGEVVLPYASSALIRKIISAFKTFLQGSWEKLQAFCQKVFQNDFLMGRKSGGRFSPHMAFLFSQKVINSVFSGPKVSVGNEKKFRSNIQRDTSLKITKRGEEPQMKISEIEPPSESALEVSRIFEEMKTLFVLETEGKLAIPHPTKRNKELAFEAYQSLFQSNIGSIQAYFSRVARSKFHMGEASNSSFKAQFSYLLRPEVIDDFMSGQITLDRTSKREEGDRLESQRTRQEVRDFKDQLSRNITRIKDEYRVFVKETESTLNRDDHTSQFQSYLEREAPYALELWCDRGWHSAQIETLFTFYVEETLMDISLEEWMSKRLAQDCPDLVSLMTDFKASMSHTHPRLIDRFCGLEWEDVLLDSLFSTYLNQRKSQNEEYGFQKTYENDERDAVCEKSSLLKGQRLLGSPLRVAQKLSISFGSQMKCALKALATDFSTDMSSDLGENVPQF